MVKVRNSQGWASVAGMALALAGAPVQAQAQDLPASPRPAAEADDAAPIVVTGSRIARRMSDSSVPLLLVSARQIEQVGDVTVGDSLRAQPAFGIPGSTPQGPQGGVFGSSQAFVNFLGQGSQRTLVLLDGRRSVSSNTASVFSPAQPGSQVDLNTIPTLMVDRIETIAIGGAPIYGSDAIAGTVNVLLRDRYDGVKLDAQYGLAGAGDAAEYRLGALAGTQFAGGRGSLVAAYEFSESKGLLASDRDVTAGSPSYVRPAPGSPYGNVYGNGVRLTAFSENGIPLLGYTIPGTGADIVDGTGRTLAFNRNGQLVPFDFGAPTGLPFVSLGGDGYDQAKSTTVLAPLRRHSAIAKATYALNDAITVHGTLSYSHTLGTTLRGDTAYNTAIAPGSNGLLFVPIDNPFLSAADRATIAAQLPPGQPGFFLARANTDVVSGFARSTTDLFRVELGAKGDLGQRFHWDVTGTFGRSLAKGETRQLIDQNFQNALAGCPAGGTSAAIPAINPTCTPFNPFGQTNSQAALDYVSALAQTRSDNRQWVVTASLRGSLFDLPGGPLDAVLGVEHRNEQAGFDPGAFFYGQAVSPNPADPRLPYGRSVPIDPVRGSYHTNEVFGEVRAPLISPDMSVALVDTLELNAAGRYVDHSTAGGAFTWTAGARWKPVSDLGFRGNYTRSIRSPAVTELFSPTSSIFAIGNDPCDARFIPGGPNPAVRQANCASAGLPGGFISNIVDFGTPGTVSGDPTLRNEVADSWTIGAIYTPHSLPGLTVSADWLDIRVKNAIIYADASQVMAACYDAASFPAAACNRIVRAPDGQVSSIATGYINAASQRYSGLLAALAWQGPARFLGRDARLQARIDYQYIDKLETRIGGGALTTQAGSIGYSRHKATGTLTLDKGPWSTFARVQYIGPAQVDPDAAPDTYDTPHRNAVAFVSWGGSVTINDRLTLRFDIDNLFDTLPPFPSPAGGGLVTYAPGVLGRYLKVGASTRF